MAFGGLWRLALEPTASLTAAWPRARAGTVSHMCPQMLIGGEVGYYCDIFSFGVVMQEVSAASSCVPRGGGEAC
jgi:hypothetical protein